MKIHIFGASGSGVTTLGLALAEKIDYPYFDNDSYFWEKSDPQFTVKRDPNRRNTMLLDDLSQTPNWILGGSMVHWGDEFPKLFDLAVFLILPPEIRLQRLKAREYNRYGDVIFTDPYRKQKAEDFIKWASGYDDNTTQSQSGMGLGRTLKVHRDWMGQLNCPVLEINGDFTVEERIKRITEVITF